VDGDFQRALGSRPGSGRAPRMHAGLGGTRLEGRTDPRYVRAVRSRPKGVGAKELHIVTDDEARSFVDDMLGRADEWCSPLISHRLTSKWQSDWKAEVGHWLKTAERHGFLPRLLRRVGRAKSGPRGSATHSNDGSSGQAVPVCDANDPHHRILAHELAPAMTTHYLVGTGWAFVAWEPITGSKVDIDVELKAPDGTAVMLQVKAPDNLG